ncbi:MAG: DNA polymerase I [Limnohabitans sp.]|nr:DNA polymerase I [Limnohabitans sp.]
MSNKPTLLLVDGSSYLYRAFHALPDLRAVPGDASSPPTGAIRGMVNMMQSLRKDVKAEYAVCVFDAKGPTFRDDLYPAYKANRSPMPDDLRLQIEPIHELVKLMGWRVLDVPGVEADDVIGTLAQLAVQQNMQVMVSSGDKDLSQLVNEHITIIDTMNGKRRDVKGVTEEFGVPPSLMIDFQTLVGDTVDNVPGVEKVGPKTAAKWLNEYGSLDALMQKADEIKGVAGENLRKAKDWLPQGKALVTIKKDCELSNYVSSLPALDDVRINAPNNTGLKDFYTRFGFKGLIKTLDDLAGHATSTETTSFESNSRDLFDSVPDFAIDQSYETILTQAQWQVWFEKIESAPLVAIDTETTSIHDMQAYIVGISFCLNAGEAAYLPLAHTSHDAHQQLSRDETLAQLKPWLEDASHLKLGQHVKYDRHVFANHGIEVKGYAHDTMLQSYVLEVHKQHSLESLAQRHINRKGLSFEELCGKGAHQITFDQVDIDRASQYACEDADFTWCVHQRLWPLLQVDEKLRFIYELEIASSEALYRIERNGVLIDAAQLAAQSHSLGQRILQIEKEAYEIAGQPFNLQSPKQLGEIFFDRLGLPVIKKTASGARSTDEEVLEKLAEDYPLPAKILEHRGLSKLKNTYTDKLAGLALPSTGRVHTHYAQAVAVTGRLSSNEPNLQNIPIRTAEGRKVREAFVAAPGCVIASADYSQIELRIMAHISEDEALLRAFHQGLDVHRATASEIFGIATDQVSNEQRRYAKVINFGLIYGMSAYGLAKALTIDNAAAKNYIERYFQRFAGVKRYMDNTRQQAKAQGYVETVFGRRLYLPEINSPNGPRRAGAERAAINAPMQGTAADLIKLSMVKVQQVLDEEKRGTRMIIQVHDELVFEVPQTEVDWLKTEIPRIMASVAKLKVDLLAEVGVGHNWEEAH